VYLVSQFHTSVSVQPRNNTIMANTSPQVEHASHIFLACYKCI